MPELLGEEPIIFSINIIADIYLGHITHWNDSAIVQLNPHLKDYLPDKPILVIFEPGISSLTERVSKLLASVPEFNRTVRAVNCVYNPLWYVY